MKDIKNDNQTGEHNIIFKGYDAVNSYLVKYQ